MSKLRYLPLAAGRVPPRAAQHPSMAPVAVHLPAEHWQAVLDAMHWDLPDLDDNGPIARNSERCFHAQQIIRHAIADRT